MPSPQSDTRGTLYGVGVGPGDPELLTLKACRLIQECDLVAYISGDSGTTMARDIAGTVLDKSRNPQQQEHTIVLSMNEDREQINRAYDGAAEFIAGYLDEGKNVVFLCLGDPFFYGSFAYLYDRLEANYAVEAIPGVTSINAAASLSGRPLGMLAENTAIISGRRNEADILQTLNQFDNVAIMKPGRRRPELLQLIEQAGRTDDSCYVEYAGLPNQRIITDIRLLDKTPGPYFSLFLINRSGRQG